MNILILKPSSLGDVVQSLPVLRLLRRHYPDSRIYWWIDASLSALLRDDPDLTDIVLFHRRRWVAPIHWPEALASILRIRRLKCDWVIDLQALARSGFVAWLARGKLTVGLDDSREGAPAFYDRCVSRPSFHTHAVDWYLEVLRRLSVPVNWDFEWLPPRPSVAKELERKWNAAAAPWIAVQPGARWGTKRWPIGNYAALVAQLAEQFPAFRFLILGTAADRELGRTIQSAAPNRCLDLTGQTSLPEMVEWLRRSELLICNDSGPMHIAAALGRPLVALFGPTEPRRTGPYGQPAAALQVQLPCVPCFKDRCFHQPRLECLSSIRPADVLLAVRQRLNLPKAG